MRSRSYAAIRLEYYRQRLGVIVVESTNPAAKTLASKSGGAPADHWKHSTHWTLARSWFCHVLFTTCVIWMPGSYANGFLKYLPDR